MVNNKTNSKFILREPIEIEQIDNPPDYFLMYLPSGKHECVELSPAVVEEYFIEVASDGVEDNK